jgi:hypothetical protein
LDNSILGLHAKYEKRLAEHVKMSKSANMEYMVSLMEIATAKKEAEKDI